ncbi:MULTISPECIES: helix-turn-helix domain-containing protein [unclassified Candidatus Frackibacter]|uniref:helix-turn-helix domain-containing protein n=1 Tax=unclassified Candidatus Frackibacter TaxID=2648818 RepID=UPI0008818B8E|nr:MULTISPECIES: helix-turn-helix domain-containing protein [unclassified Candidatus Frackibacter]SDC31632.1 DNA binding domain-containing protein, excisionase family [Candidatus Frackibacter sp. WG11]SEM73215.1 DNA binding domain-containing protein, excisionase family [Candidatus Frackibacter sp. WG12]SFL59475.1 DNA binding domain-containing protein, excisionase family [Candidatus Frackibacter sp. WG13]
MAGVMEEILEELREMNEKLDNLSVGTTLETEMMSVKEAADFLKISKGKMYEMIRQNEVPYVSAGKRKLISKQALLEWIEEEAETEQQAAEVQVI